MAWFLLVLLFGLASSTDVAAQSAPSYLEFEAGPVRPLALSADGARLYACNIPDDRLEIFDVTATGLVLSAAVPVGMSPVALAVRSASEVWVVNHLSDSVSIVDTSVSPPRVVRTLLVGDEPRDIVFAANGRAFITTAHRGEQRVDPSLAKVPGAGDPQLDTPGVGRADVWVFDPAKLGGSVGGTPLAIVNLFGDKPRALAVQGNTVYAAVLHSGNETASVGEATVCDGFWEAAACAGDALGSPNGLPDGKLPGGVPPPSVNAAGIAAPESGLIVKYDRASGQWRDGFARNWSNGVRFHLPDKDVFAIDAASLEQTAVWQHVGTTLFNMAVHPVSGKLYVSNTEAQNLTRFEGSGAHVSTLGAGYPMPPTVQGNLAQSRISILAPDASVVVRRLNPHIDYALRPAPAGVAESSLATPLTLAFSQDGARVFVAAYGSNKIGVIPTAALEDGSFDATREAAHYITLRGGPAGLALDEAHASLYVLNRFDNSVSRVDLDTGSELQSLKMSTPEPTQVVQGRPFLYDAQKTSSNGEAACASCHIFGDMDQLAWDLGNPDDVVTANPLPIELINGETTCNDQNGGASLHEFHPMKGPMTTQTLKGMVYAGPMHWRGDRSNGELGKESRTSAPFDSQLSFMNFIVATKALNGRATEVEREDMQKLTAFALRLTLPPNPIRRLDNDLRGAHGQLPLGNPHQGREYFFGRVGAPSTLAGLHLTDGTTLFNQALTCDGCHANSPRDGYFGTNGKASFENMRQIFKVAGLRNLYDKIGMFGQPNSAALEPGMSGSFAHQGDQVRGFGFDHEGSVDTVFRFLQMTQFRKGGFLDIDPNVGFENDQQRRDVEAYVYAFDSDLPPIVGQQVTLTDGNARAVAARIDLLLARASAPFESKLLGSGARECELIAKTVVDGVRKGFLRKSDGLFQPDDGGPALTDAQLRALAVVPGQTVTYTAVPFGSGTRMGIDRDLDGVLDGVDPSSDDGTAQATLPPRPRASRPASPALDVDLDAGEPSARPDAGRSHADADARDEPSQAAPAVRNEGSSCALAGTGDGRTSVDFALIALGFALCARRSRRLTRARALDSAHCRELPLAVGVRA